MRYSVVVPVYNEEQSIVPLYASLKKVMDSFNEEYELLFVNDGSTDNTLRNLAKLKEKEPRLKIIDFRRNFGKSAALRAGFDYSQGDVIVTMDGDLQEDPKEIPKLLEKLGEYDVVSGWRFSRKDSFTKVLASRCANWLQRKMMGVPIHDTNCCFKVYKKEAALDVPLYGELHRFIPVLLLQKGYSIGEVKITHRPRKYGRSKYGLVRLLRGFLDLVDVKFWSHFESRPLHLFGSFGLLLTVSGAALGATLTVLRLLQLKSLSRSVLPLFAVGLVLVGVQFMILGMLASLIVKGQFSDKSRKPYRIRKIL
jgi:glycosyltransferase involved in cell wall biosynthesis